MGQRPILDPNRILIVEADGPVSLAVRGDRTIVTLTQYIPPLKGDQERDAVVVGRFSFRKEALALLLKKIDASGALNAPQPAKVRELQ